FLSSPEDWFVVLLAGPFFEKTKEVQTPTELISVFARNCLQDEPAPLAPRVDHLQLEGESIQVQHCRPRSACLSAALKEGLVARSTPSGSAATAAYFALARQMKFQVKGWCLCSFSGAKMPLWQLLPGHQLMLVRQNASPVQFQGTHTPPMDAGPLGPSSSTVDVFLFHTSTPAAECWPGSLILAPTGSGKSTWRSLAPIYCPEGEVMEDVTFHPSYHKSIRLSSGAWLSSAATEIFLRDLALLMRWLRSAGGPGGTKRITFNCSGEAVAEVVLVLPPESVHRRNLASRRASDAAEETTGNDPPAKKFKRDASLSEFEAGAKTNRETLLAAAQKCGVHVVATFAAAAPAVRMYCKLRLLGKLINPRPFVGDPSQLTEFYDVTMACGRRIHGWLHKDAPVGAQPTVWQISASVLKGAEAENAYVLKTLSGSILLTDGRTLISAEVWVFWVLALVPINFSAKTTKDVTKMHGLQLHAAVCDGCAGLGVEDGPWPQAVLLLPQDRLVPNESEKAGSIRSHLPMPNAWLSAAAILWYPGSFAPFHVGHLNCLRAAKKELSEHLHLAGAYVQPQPFGHLAYKKLDDKSALLAADVVRLTMLEHVISKEDWVMVDPRAVLRGKGSNLEHLNALRRNLQAAREHVAGYVSGAGEVLKSLEIVWVMGDDAFPGFREKFLDPNSWHSKQMARVLQEGRFRLCVVHNRPSQRTHCERAGLPFEVLEVDAAGEFSGDFSATALRTAWLKGAGESELSKFLGSQEAARYLCSLR
ncbi:unnamed protein product, partial [Cladocopium goreaui]